MLRSSLLAMASNNKLKNVVTALPPTRAVVSRFVSGETVGEAIPVLKRLADDGLLTTVDFLGEDVVTKAQADKTVTTYLDLLQWLAAERLTHTAEVSVKLSALGQKLPGEGHQIALDNARTICTAAQSFGTTVTLDMEDHTTTDDTLAVLRELRTDFPFLGAVLQAYLHRTRDDCRALATPGSRIRLCKGAYNEPAEVAYRDAAAVDKSYVRCLRTLMEGKGYPMVATHDPRLIAIAGELASRNDRGADSFEYQMLFGIRPSEQRRLAAAGNRVRVYVPFGTDWYAYFMRRLAERPANVGLLVNALARRR